MPILAKLKEFLDSKKVPYTVHTHATAYTAQEVAAAQHVTGHAVAKVVIVKADQRLVMLVLPADRRVDFPALKSVLGLREAELAAEAEFTDVFPGSEVGAMPPFGNLYDVPVYVDRALEKMPEIVFNAGTHTQTVRMGVRDYLDLVKPTGADFTVHV
jgi:Ala-tRNA(Pro) deacylase